MSEIFDPDLRDWLDGTLTTRELRERRTRRALISNHRDGRQQRREIEAALWRAVEAST
jgi:hypothetical protein